MPETPTPGQVNFVAWQCDITGCGTDDAVDMWPLLGRVEQRAWEAAAQAVLAWQSAQVPGTAGWLTAHPPPPLTDAARAALDATLEAFSEPEGEEAGGACSRTEENPCETHHLSE